MRKIEKYAVSHDVSHLNRVLDPWSLHSKHNFSPCNHNVFCHFYRFSPIFIKIFNIFENPHVKFGFPR